jgi:hypothetical protein
MVGYCTDEWLSNPLVEAKSPLVLQGLIQDLLGGDTPTFQLHSHSNCVKGMSNKLPENIRYRRGYN